MDNRTYHLTTFGCQMNEHDSERIRGVLEAGGWLEAPDEESARLLVFNTCSVRESAESRLIGRLGEARRLKGEDPGRIVALGGCFAQSRQEAILDELRFLDVAFGPRNIGELPELVEAAAKSGRQASSFVDEPGSVASLPSARRGSHHAWVQVMTGCTNYCSYCIVPYVRGEERSREAQEILAEVERLVDEGVVEVTLLGQNVNAYGLDRSGPGSADFAGLLEMLDAVKGLRRIRFTTSHPRDLGQDLVEAMRDLESVCEHLHLPAQSGSTRILERMNRGYTAAHYLGLVSRFYDKVPGASLTTDLIVGFPAEKEDDFFATLSLVEQCRFDSAFTFIYSPREGTAAAEMPGQVPDVTRKRRMGELVALVQRIALEKNESMAGSEVEVLVEGRSRQGGGQFRGRTRSNKIVNFAPAGPGEPTAGDFVQVRVASVTSTTMKGVQAPAHPGPARD
ncbi:MAG: tRNA (N6-isopentenyl adenosine(37)-C2)-methylthiotransferase MiaB [Gaiellales bacterium]|nr:MAG: tRNA (N6-isopentenyl adenosine(37)-C2)-methylthiotransferase MiaB [Gaiellales bacterium]